MEERFASRRGPASCGLAPTTKRDVRPPDRRYEEARRHGFEFAERIARAEAVASLLATEFPELMADGAIAPPTSIRLDLEHTDNGWCVTSKDAPGLLLAMEKDRSAACRLAALASRQRISLLTPFSL